MLFSIFILLFRCFCGCLGGLCLFIFALVVLINAFLFFRVFFIDYSVSFICCRLCLCISLLGIVYTLLLFCVVLVDYRILSVCLFDSSFILFVN